MAKKAADGGNVVGGENTIYKVSLSLRTATQEGPRADYDSRRRIGMCCTGLRVMKMTNHFSSCKTVKCETLPFCQQKHS